MRESIENSIFANKCFQKKSLLQFLCTFVFKSVRGGFSMYMFYSELCNLERESPYLQPYSIGERCNAVK